MNYKKCVYFVEGPCEEKLINALNKVQPYLLNPGKPNVHNVVQELIPRNTIIRVLCSHEHTYDSLRTSNCLQ